MKNPADIPAIDAAIPGNAVSIYNQDNDALDDFPVLKAFQQYLDSEQTKARKRMLMLSVFFGGLMILVIAVFLTMLMNISARNQTLNDRMIELAMNNRLQSAPAAPVVVQPASQDGSALMALNAKIEYLQQKLSESQAKDATQPALTAAPADAGLAAKRPSAAELEVERLKAMLELERSRNSAEKERQRQAEIEAYRRKHYPELYADELPRRQVRRRLRINDELDELALEDDDLERPAPNSKQAIRYFDEDDEDELPPPEPAKSADARRIRKSAPAASATTPPPAEPPAAEDAPAAKTAAAAEKTENSIPVKIGESSVLLSIPNE